MGQTIEADQRDSEEENVVPLDFSLYRAVENPEMILGATGRGRNSKYKVRWSDDSERMMSRKELNNYPGIYESWRRKIHAAEQQRYMEKKIR